MTKKTLSQKICEECGIKPLYKIKHFNGVIEVWSPAFNKEELRCAKAQKQILEQKEVYPDFEKNNDNFVKLYELKIIDNISLAELLFKWNIANYSRETFLNNLFYITKPDSNISSNTKEQIKQAIREADWVYE